MSTARERKNTILGDRCAFCPSCGWARRYLLTYTEPPAGPCPDCGTKLVVACPGCEEPPESFAQVACRHCGTPLRDDDAFGSRIRRRPEPAPTQAILGGAADVPAEARR